MVGDSAFLGVDRYNNRYWNYGHMCGGSSGEEGRVHVENGGDGSWRVMVVGDPVMALLMGQLGKEGVEEGDKEIMIDYYNCSYKSY